MQRVILQVPMTKELKEKAEAVSRDSGFSSLQEAIRVLVTKLSQRELVINVLSQEKEEIVRLSPAAKKRYARIAKDIENGRNVTKTKNLDELFKLLE